MVTTVSKRALYLINLDRATERLSAAKCEIAKLGPHYTVSRVSAVDGRHLTDIDVASVTSGPLGNCLDRALVGCAMSHFKTWRKFLSTQQQVALVCEDDVRFVDRVDERLELAYQNTPHDFDVLFVGHHQTYESNLSPWSYVERIVSAALVRGLNFALTMKDTPVNNFVFLPAFVTALHCYFISRKGAERMLRYFEKNGIAALIDHSLNALLDSGKMYALVERLAFQSTRVKVSTIAQASHPLAATAYLDGNDFTDVDGTSLAYKLSMPLFDINGWRVNLWWLIHGITAIVIALLMRSVGAGTRATAFVLATLYVISLVVDQIYAEGADLGTRYTLSALSNGITLALPVAFACS
ncbi:hypothetical protein HDU93_007971 [Gonapodya sp. JEL0774]|nr:hypothetical protein HDU93_007971 [Gonapodya sp. JEL0774]